MANGARPIISGKYMRIADLIGRGFGGVFIVYGLLEATWLVRLLDFIGRLDVLQDKMPFVVRVAAMISPSAQNIIGVVVSILIGAFLIAPNFFKGIIGSIGNKTSSRLAFFMPLTGAGIFISLIILLAYFQLNDEAPSCYMSSSETVEIRKIKEAFQTEIKNHKDKLGPEIDCLKRVRNSSTGGFERAQEVWIENPRSIFFLLRSPERFWKQYPESSPCNFTWCSLLNEPARRAHFEALFKKIPWGYKPPFGGTAALLNEDHNLFKMIGWQVWQCERATAGFYQKFQNGSVYGVYPSQINDNAGQMFALYNDKTWDVFEPGIQSPVCGQGSF